MFHCQESTHFISVNRAVLILTLATGLCVSNQKKAQGIPPVGSSPTTPANNSQGAAQIPKESDALFLNFLTWSQRYQSAPKNQKTAFIAQGIELAKQRKQALLALFDSDPKRAQSWALPWRTRAFLPMELTPFLETPVGGCGDFSVLAARIPNPKTGAMQVQIMRYSTIKGKVYKTRVYGRRQGLTTKYNISQHGIAFDNVFLLQESPVKILEAGETLPPDPLLGDTERKCPLCGTLANSEKSVAVSIGDTHYVFDSLEHAQRVESEIIKRETKVGPTEGSVCDAPLSKLIEEIKQADAKRAAGNEDAEEALPLDRRDAPFGDPVGDRAPGKALPVP